MLPTGSAYVQALQFPAACFIDRDLAACTVEAGPLGLPRPISGNVASVFKLTHPDGRRWAVRCFVRFFEDQQRRYDAIAQRLAAIDAPWRVGFELQPEGILVNGEAHPIVKMQWADGVPLDAFVDAHLWDGDRLADTAVRFATLLEELRALGIAHGDLQHGNILVTEPGDLRLIDYDGMYVPALAGFGSNELGHRNYRHPSRTMSDFGAGLDDFAGWVIYLSLAATSVDPLLWGRLDGGEECLLFREADFTAPDESEAFATFARDNDDAVRWYGAILRGLLDVPIADLPALALSAAPDLAPPRGTRPTGPTEQERALFAALRTADDAPLPTEDESPTGGVLGRIRRMTHGEEATAPEIEELRLLVSRAEAEVEALVGRRARLDTAEEAQRQRVASAQKAVIDREEAEVRQIADDLVRERTLVVQRERELDQAERDERAALVAELAEKERREQMFRERIAGAPGIGDGLVFALARHDVRLVSDYAEVRADGKSKKQGGGLVRTADGREFRIASIGPDQAATLMRWKKNVESRVTSALPTELPEQDELDLRKRYADEKRTVRAREPQAREEAARREEDVHARADADLERLAGQLRQLQQEAAVERVRIDKALASARKAAAEARWRLDQARPAKA